MPNHDDQFPGLLIEAATAAADAHRRELVKRKRDEEIAYAPATGSSVNTFQHLNRPISEEQPRRSDVPQRSILSGSAASILFREPSERSKKYSRPPLGKVFASLELAPEAFLQLQNSAKQYMLSDEFPDRRDVVGQKRNQNSGNDQAKLRLYQAVEGFLLDNNNGETFFGHSAEPRTPDAPIRTFFWPEDRGRIIKVLMPLLRKMVTNERQRIYAAETRNKVTKKDDTRSHSVASGQPRTDDSQGTWNDHRSMEPAPPEETEVHQEQADGESPEHDQVDSSTLKLYINLVSLNDGVRKRIMPEFNLPAEEAGGIDQLIDGLRANLDDMDGPMIVKALLPQTGLTEIRTEEDWLRAKFSCFPEEWMDNRLTIVVEI